MMQEAEIRDFAVRGPRTVRWVLRFVAENGGTPIGRRTKFKSDARVSASDPGAGERELPLQERLEVAPRACGAALAR